MFCSRLYFRYSDVLYRIITLENQKGLTRYSKTLCKLDSTAGILLLTIFWTSVFQNSSKPLIVKGFYLLRMSNDQMIITFVGLRRQLAQCNRRNTETVLRAVIKSHQGLKGTKVFTYGCSERHLRTEKNPCWSSFIV